MKAFIAGTVLACGVVAVAAAQTQRADAVLVNGKIVTGDRQFSGHDGSAIGGGRGLGGGAWAEVRMLADRESRIIDLQGRTVIPGLIDSHLHAIRAGLSFSTEVSWVGAASIVEALDRIGDASRTMKPGAWLIVARSEEHTSALR